MFADLEVDRAEMEEWLAAAPGGAEAFARAYDRIGQGAAPAVAGSDPLDLVRRGRERWRHHFADLDAAGGLLADEWRHGAGELYGEVAERRRRIRQGTKSDVG